MGVSQITAPGKMLEWQPRPDFLPLVTAGQKPVFLDDTNILWSFGRNDFDGRKFVFLPPETKPFVTITNQTTVRILRSDFGNNGVDIEVNATEKSLVVLAQSYYHDWKATVDGEPADILRANFAFQAVQVPKGMHSIYFFYRDDAFRLGWNITLAALVVCVAGLLFWRDRV